RPDESRASRVLDEVEAYGFLDQLSIPHAPAPVLDVSEDLTQLDTTGVSFPYPVGAKVLDSQIAHKSDVGGVVLHIADDHALREAVARIVASVGQARPEVTVRRILV